MAIVTDAGTDTGIAPGARPWWTRPAIHTAIIGAIAGYALGHWLGNVIAASYQQLPTSDANDTAIVLGYTFMIIGWLAGLGVLNDLFSQILGRPLADAERENGNGHNGDLGVARYFRYTMNHKVVGIQYLVAMIAYFCTAGLLAMGIRTELLSPTTHIFNASWYATLVGEHGTMMMMLMTSAILGPFGNYFVPIMIGAKRVAFPRLEALSFWLTPMAYVILLTTNLLGGFPFGWTGYAPLSIQSTSGADAYFYAFGLMGISMVLAGFIFLVAMGTFWKAKIKFTVPVLFCIAWGFNFLLGGISGVFVSDVPADVTEHGTFFVMAHFHYTIMGGLIFAFMAGCYYWLPKMTGVKLNDTLGKWHFWLMFLGFNSTFMPLFAVGLLGQPRRVFEYQQNLQTLNDWVSISSYVLGLSILIFVLNFVWSTVLVRERVTGNLWKSRGLEWQVPSPPPSFNFEQVPVVLTAPYEYGVQGTPPVADLNPPVGVLVSAFSSSQAVGSDSITAEA